MRQKVTKEIYRSALTPETTKIIAAAENYYANSLVPCEITCLRPDCVTLRTTVIGGYSIGKICGKRIWTAEVLRDGRMQISIFAEPTEG